jgi:hypothetical protein
MYNMDNLINSLTDEFRVLLLYGVMGTNQGKEFFPFVVETFGGLGRDAI